MSRNSLESRISKLERKMEVADSEHSEAPKIELSHEELMDFLPDILPAMLADVFGVEGLNRWYNPPRTPKQRERDIQQWREMLADPEVNAAAMKYWNEKVSGDIKHTHPDVPSQIRALVEHEGDAK